MSNQEDVVSVDRVGIDRRRVVKGIAWGVPVITAVSAAPAMANSPVQVTIASTQTLINIATREEVPFFGVGPANYQLTIQLGTVSLGTVTVEPDGSWELDVTIPLGIQDVMAEFTAIVDGGSASTAIRTDTLAPSGLSIVKGTYTSSSKISSCPATPVLKTATRRS